MIKTNEIKSWYLLYPLIFAASVLIIVSRRPDALFNPQFWAEDGNVWYADAYNQGIIYSLSTPEAGYFQTFSRLVGIFSQMFPLAYAPLVFNVVAILVQITVAGFIASPRFSLLVPKLGWRLVLAFLYLALPHSFEINANVTNTQWHLGLLSFLIVVAEPSERSFWRVFDVSVLVISVLSGPLCLLLVPMACLRFWQRRERWPGVLLSILVIGAIVQTCALLTNARPTQAGLGAEVGLFFKITFRHIFVTPIIGQGGFHLLMERFDWNIVLVGLVCLFGAFLVVYSLLKSIPEVRLFILLAILIYAASLVSPASTPVDGQWAYIAANNTSLRYWFIPGFCTLVSLMYLASNAASRIVKFSAVGVLVLVPYGIIKDWTNPSFKDFHFATHAEEFEKAVPGSEVTIPINPNWEMKLIKKN